MDRIIHIGNKTVGQNQPCFIIAEAGVNHNGDIRIAKSLIDAAAHASADAVKFQTFSAEHLVTKYAKKADYQKKSSHARTQYELLKNLELSDDDFRSLSRYAAKKGIIFLSTPFDTHSVSLLGKLRVPAYKVSSGELTNHPLLKEIAEKKKPVILSTGMATIGEIAESVAVLKSFGTEDIILLHCTTEYPVQYEYVNLRALETLQTAFRLPTGFSDHTQGILMSVAAVALGACVIEKHFTMDKKMEGPDHKASLDPMELRDLVQSIRNLEKGLGNGIKEPAACEVKNKLVARKSIVAKMNLRAGTLITGDMLDLKRPGTGLEPKFIEMVVGKRLNRDIGKDELFSWEYIA